MRAIGDIERAYLAGLFDGEGCVRLGYARNIRASERKTKQFWIQISNTDTAIIDYLKSTMGGTTVSMANGIGRKRLFAWKLHHQNAVDFLEMIVPYLRIKREKALLILDNWEIVLKPVREEVDKQRLMGLANQMRELNKRGTYRKEELTPRNILLGANRPFRDVAVITARFD